MSEAALRAAIPPHFSKDSPCWPIFSQLHGIRTKLEEIGRAKTHSLCVRCASALLRVLCAACLRAACAAWAECRGRLAMRCPDAHWARG
jgi:hypothetical protein